MESSGRYLHWQGYTDPVVNLVPRINCDQVFDCGMCQGGIVQWKVQETVAHQEPEALWG